MEPEQIIKKDQFSFLVYDENGLPKYFSISKLVLRSLIYGLPTITALCVLGVASFLIYFKQIRAVVIRKEPEVIKNLRQENSKLTQSKIKLQGHVQELVTKSAATKINNIELGQLLLFNTPAGFTDQTRTPIFSIEEISLIRDNTKIRLRFNIVNQTKNFEKRAGYAFVIMKEQNQFHIYPHLKEDSSDMHIKYNAGESFATTKFRPVTAQFKGSAKKGILLFKILIFSRSGDLLHKHFMTSTALEKE